MVTIISTHPVSVRYNMWEIDESTHSKRRVWDCLIPGGSGVVNKHTLKTPQGVATEIDEAALENLMKIPSFVADIDSGFIKVLKRTRARAVDADAEAEKDMNLDGSGKQITSEDLENAGAEINSDGSIDVSKGGAKAMAIKRSGKTDKPSKKGRK